MIARISWRNVWRNKVRSGVLISSIAFGITGGILILAFSWGMSIQYVNIAIKDQISHIQIHNPEFKKEKLLRYIISDSENIINKVKLFPDVQSVSSRTILNGMISSANTGVGVKISGINPDQETGVTDIRDKIVAGDYLENSLGNQILIGEKLSNKLKVRKGNKIVLTFQDSDGNITAGAFRISGIFKTRNSTFDEMNVYVCSSELNELLGIPLNASHEVAILLRNNHDLESVKNQLKEMFPGLMVEDWQEIAPELRLVVDSLSQTLYLFISIILLALIFGIVNTMLMSVLERFRELGILMAIGMNKIKLFAMIMTETLYISLIGGISGIIMAYIAVSIAGKTGIDLSSFSAGLSSYGIDSVVYPMLPGYQYLVILLMVFFAAVLAAVYPSVKALKLKPVTAIRKI